MPSNILVLYTLYARVAQSLPTTSYIKVIEIWLLFHLFIPFFIFFVIFWQEHKPEQKISIPENKYLNRSAVSVSENDKNYLNKFSTFILPMIIVIFAFVFFIVCLSGY